ncbi:hypothetical protein [Paenibacillus chitinolyticus]
MTKRKELKQMALGSITAIAATALIFGGISRTVKAAEFGKPQTVPTSYSISYAGEAYDIAPPDYVRKDYQIKFAGKDQPSANDMTMEEAAELASQNLWRIFQVDLSGRTMEMTYNPNSPNQLRATWEAHIKFSDVLSYAFTLDAVTGENRSAAKQVYHQADIPEGMDKNLIKNNLEYKALAKAAAEKYEFISSKITSVEYISQGYQENQAGAKNADITFQVKSDNNEVAQLSFSRYNQELLSVEYGSWLEEAERNQKRMEQEAKERTPDIILTDEVVKKIQENGVPIR